MKPISCTSYLDDIVYTKIYTPECDGELKDTPPPSGLIYVQAYQIEKLFKLCEQTDNEYVVVSAFGDMGVDYMFSVPAHCGLKSHCKPDHNYVIRADTVGIYSFNNIPDNIKHWYCVNANVAHKKITPIPFGISPDFVDTIEDYYVPFDQKKDKIYVNWSDNTNERRRIKEEAKGHKDYVVVPDKYYGDHDRYFKELAQYKFVLCPSGNGFDSYRIWETLYVGSIPVVVPDVWCMHWMLQYVLFPYKFHEQLPNVDELLNTAFISTPEKLSILNILEEIQA